MIGETNLQKLLRNMTPMMDDYVYVFCKNVEGVIDAAGIRPLSRFVEDEGSSFIVKKTEAERADIDFTYPCRKITLHIHSSLEAVGFLAAITNALAAKGISVNPVSAFYHDHLFVPADRAEDTMEILREFIRN